ncbi:MAG: tyrosine-type recombinase/integrase [Chloroflexota bacterium]
MSEKLSVVAAAYLGKFKSSTLRSVKRDLMPFIEWVGPAKLVTEVTQFDLLRYAGEKINCDDCNGGKGPYANNTRRIKLKAIRIFFNWCEKNGLIEKNASDILEIPPETRSHTRDKAFSDDDVALLVRYAEGEMPNAKGVRRRRLRDLALFLFCHDVGVRRNSLGAIMVEHIDLAAQTVVITDSKSRTGPARRVVKFGDYTARVLAEWLEKKPGGFYLWSTRDNSNPMADDSMSQIVGRACDEIGVRRRSIHAFRHGLAHRMLDAKVPPNFVATALGNTEAVVLAYYAPKDDESAWEAAQSVSLPDPDAEKKISRFPDGKTG